MDLKPLLAHQLWWALLWWLWVPAWSSQEVLLWWVLQSLSLALQAAQYHIKRHFTVHTHSVTQHGPEAFTCSPAVVGAAVVVVGACVVVTGGATVVGAPVVVTGAAGRTVPHQTTFHSTHSQRYATWT